MGAHFTHYKNIISKKIAIAQASSARRSAGAGVGSDRNQLAQEWNSASAIVRQVQSNKIEIDYPS